MNRQARYMGGKVEYHRGNTSSNGHQKELEAQELEQAIARLQGVVEDIKKDRPTSFQAHYQRNMARKQAEREGKRRRDYLS